MKMRFLAFFLTLCLIFSMVPANVFAVTFDSQDGVGSGEEMSTVANEEPIEEPSEEVTEEITEESEEPEVVDEAEELAKPEEPEEPDMPIVPGEGCPAYEDGMHVHEDVVTDPTCTEQGYTTYTCACGDMYVADYVDAQGHSYENGLCTGCGEEEPVVIAAPVISSANIAKTGKVKLTWTKVEGAVQYILYLCDADGNVMKATPTTKTVMNHNSAKVGESYNYYVVAVAADGTTSEPSNIANHTGALAQPVITVSNIEKTGKVNVSWNAVEGAAKYTLYTYAADGTLVKTHTTTKTSINHSSGKAGETYSYQVCAECDVPAATSAPAEAVSATFDLAQPVVTGSNNAETGRVMLTWNKVAGAVKYQIYRSTSKNGTYNRMHTTTSTVYTNTNATPGTTYYYKVVARAEDAEADSAFSAIVQRTADVAQPIVTAGADVNTGKPRLNWEPVEGAVKYKVYRATTVEGPYSLMYTTAGTTYQNTKAEIGQTYYYKVRALSENANAHSSYSPVMSVMCASSTYDFVYSSFSTTKSGTAERNTNLTLSCQAINGTILAPGDTFSFNEIVGPRTAAKGYQAAPIVGGMGRGGGICQVSTTLFNVALYGNMKITQRRQHSVAVTYVPLGRDAMIYKTASDLKFVNDSPYYIKVVASSSNGVVKISLMTREPNVSPKSDVDLRVSYSSGTYTLKRYYEGKVNYTCTSKYKG